MEQIRCNCCGQLLKQGEHAGEDYLKVTKEWGYFSEKDLELHEWYLCEKCYDSLIQGFKIPIKIQTIEEVL